MICFRDGGTGTWGQRIEAHVAAIVAKIATPPTPRTRP